MASDIQIISDAFILLGKAPISSPTTDNGEYSAAKDIYDRLIPNMLTVNIWRFAMKNLQLSESTEVSPFDRWSKVFLMPAEQLLASRTDPLVDYEIFEDKLYTNEGTIKLEFIFKASEANFPPYFTRAVTFQLAADIAMTVTQTITIAQFWEQKAQKQLLVAKHLDSTIMPNTPIIRDNIWGSHFGTGRALNFRF